ncbi:MAG: PIN domain-containing protein [Deltaproteobacteria bacterium]|nr:PIN domain-containing protein [Deltaproteobacteria bacterium]
MILVDTGPIIGLFDPSDPFHSRSVKILQQIHEPLYSTLPVLTEAFHMLNPGSLGADNLRSFVIRGGLSIWPMDEKALLRAFELMKKYADHPMDLADASLVSASEALKTRRVFTIDRDDFETYRVKIGHRTYPIEIIK